jgi:hypothetical protein
MPAPPAKTALSGTPSRAATNTAMGALYDYLIGLLGSSGNQPEAQQALGVLSAARTNSVPVNTSALTPGECLVTASGLTLASGLAAGNTYMIYNDGAGSITITQGAGVTLRVAGTTSTGNRTLSGRGMASVWVRSTNEYIISGAGLL